MTWNSDNDVVDADERRLLGDVLNERDALRLRSREVDRQICELEDAIAAYDPQWLADNRRRRLLEDGRTDPRDIIARLRYRLAEHPALDEAAQAQAESLLLEEDVGDEA